MPFTGSRLTSSIHISPTSVSLFGAGLTTPPECLTEGLLTLLTSLIEGLLH
jgi:hypothetical protein